MFGDAVHPDDHGDHEKRGDQEEQAFKSVFADVEAFQSNGYGEAEGDSGGDASPDKADQMSPIGSGEINKDNANDERGFNTLTKGDEEGREQAGSS
jgi:hypothetical protein